jgi:ParB family chromosome partitioning protein
VEVEAEPDASAAAQIERIVDQLGENQHRANIVDVDEVRAHQQLLDLGLSAAQIARQTRTPAKRVRATTTVARSELAAAVLDRYDITLDQAAVIAGFDDGTPAGREAIKTLTVTAQREPERFAHVVQRVRNDREDTALIAARAAELTDAGIAVLADPDDHATARRTTDLRPRADDPSGTPLRSADHASCPGHAVHLTVLRRWWMREEGPQVQEESYCLDPNTHGHADRYAGAAAQGPGSQGSGSSYAGLSEEEKETRRAEKRRVVENNKAWDAAVTVRREWLRTVLLARKRPRRRMPGATSRPSSPRAATTCARPSKAATSWPASCSASTSRPATTPGGRTRSRSSPRPRARPRPPCSPSRSCSRPPRTASAGTAGATACPRARPT